MRIDLNEAKRAPGGAKRYVLEESMDPLELGGEEVVLAGPVRADLTVTGSEDMFWVEGKVGATGEFRCSRCLAPVLVPLEAEILEKYYPPSATADEDTVCHHGDHLDVTREVQKALLQALPMKQLCRVDCRGLCPVCGRDLNDGPCGCSVEAVDPRLAPLAGFFKDR